MGTSTKERTAANKKAFLDTLRATLGNVTQACEEVGIDRATFYKWKQRDKAFAAKVEEANEVSLDFAEHQLKRKIKEGDTTAIIFYLKTRGKERGYVEKTLIDQKTELKLDKPMTQEEAREYLDKIKEQL